MRPCSLLPIRADFRFRDVVRKGRRTGLQMSGIEGLILHSCGLSGDECRSGPALQVRRSGEVWIQRAGTGWTGKPTRADPGAQAFERAQAVVATRDFSQPGAG